VNPFTVTAPSYPETQAARDAWILSHRHAPPERSALDPFRPWAFFVEEEACGAIIKHDGAPLKPPVGLSGPGCSTLIPEPCALIPISVATVFLTNRECPWRCLMCDLWKNTLTESVPAGAIPAQIDYALARLALARQIKLYNSGSFFDPRAVPVGDYAAIACRVVHFERVIVESHPALIGENCFRFNEHLSGRLEVAMGLETVHPETLEKLNKRMTLEQFAAAAGRLREHDIDLRVFILVKPPFMVEEEALYWAGRSLGFAFDCGATAATLIPTRGGNGAMEELAAAGDFSPPSLSTLEAALAYGIKLHRGRVFVDLWGVKAGTKCPQCHPARVERLREMNLSQSVLDPVVCADCGAKN